MFSFKNESRIPTQLFSNAHSRSRSDFFYFGKLRRQKFGWFYGKFNVESNELGLFS